MVDPTTAGQPLVYVNEAFCRMTGYSKEECLGRNARFMQGQDTSSEAVANLRAAVQEGKDCSVEILNYRKNGDAFWNLVSITPVQDTAGKVMSFIGVHSDITELVRRREAEKELQEAKVPACVDSLCVLPMLTAFVYYLSCLLRPCLH
eukprot:jgi/Astpho2/1990/e_gw1.00038.317.1_t